MFKRFSQSQEGRGRNVNPPARLANHARYSSAEIHQYLTVPFRRWWASRRHPPAKGFTNFVESSRYSRISLRVPPPRSRNLKGRQVKVPHRAHKIIFFSPAVSVPLCRPFPRFIPAPLRTKPDVAPSRTRASFFRSGRTIGNMWHEG